jgi:hypothetical protein
MKKTHFLTVLALFSLQVALFSQTYNRAAGIRVGDGLDLTFKQYLRNNWTAEGIAHTSILSENLGATVVVAKHHKFLVRNFGYYYGIGGHYYARKDRNRVEPTEITNNVAGLTGMVGVELSIHRLNVSLDMRPELHLVGDQSYPAEWNPFAVSVRYIIDKRERRRIRDWKVFDKMRRD